MRVSVYTGLDASLLGPDWGGMGPLLADAPFSLRYSWLRTWEESYGGDHSVSALVAEDGGGAAGVIPLMEREGVVRFLSDNCSDYAGPVTRSHDLEIQRQMADGLAVAIRGKRAVFWNLEVAQPFVHLLSESLRRVGRRVVRVDQRVYRQDLQRADPLSTRAHLRRNLQVRERALEELGVTFERYDRVDAGLVDQMTKLHILRWSARGERSKFLDSRRQAFLVGVVDPARGLGASVFGLSHEGELIAYRLGFSNGKIFWDWNTSFSVSWARFGPGVTLLSKALEYHRRRGFVEWDFLRGTEPYKEPWATDWITLRTLEVDL